MNLKIDSLTKYDKISKYSKIVHSALVKNRKRGKNPYLLPGSSKNNEGRDSRPAAAGAWKRRSERGHVSAAGE